MTREERRAKARSEWQGKPRQLDMLSRQPELFAEQASAGEEAREKWDRRFDAIPDSTPDQDVERARRLKAAEKSSREWHAAFDDV